jgi:hypothetical protein
MRVIRDGDRLRLAPGVRLRRAGLSDEVRGTTFPLNETGRLVLEAEGTPLGQVALRLAGRFKIPAEVALIDVRAFSAELNARLLANVEPADGRLRRAVARLDELLPLLLVRSWPAAVRRRSPIYGRSGGAAVRSVARALAPTATAVGVLVSSFTAFALAGVGAPQLKVPLVLGSAAAIGLIVHEAAHAAALGATPACLATAGLRAWILHAPLPPLRGAIVAAFGPAAGIATGGAAVVAAMPLESSEIALGALVLVGQGLGLTVVGRDGRNACGLR